MVALLTQTIRHFQRLKMQWPSLSVPLWWVRIVRYEYWPFWLFYAPLAFYYLYLALKARSFTYFTVSNPGIEMGGVFGESKMDILHKIPVAYVPKTVFVEAGRHLSGILSQLENAAIAFPVIVKPNVGERGQGVEKIEDASALKTYLQEHPENLIIQEYLAEAHEFGILYYRYPDGSQSGITSVVSKEFLKVKGDGKSTLCHLLHGNTRARFQWQRLRQKLGKEAGYIPARGETILLEPIGNHCRGTQFNNANALINKQLVKVFDQITESMKGFYYGRFDLKVSQVEDLYKGQVKIMEVNGVTSEPGHIYDPTYKLWQAYRDVAAHMKILGQISRQNRHLGVPYIPLRQVARRIYQHFME